jgi:hypothetical protein
MRPEFKTLFKDIIVYAIAAALLAGAVAAIWLLSTPEQAFSSVPL